jgi:hypothetical protein
MQTAVRAGLGFEARDCAWLRRALASYSSSQSKALVMGLAWAGFEYFCNEPVMVSMKSDKYPHLARQQPEHSRILSGSTISTESSKLSPKVKDQNLLMSISS